MTDSGRKSNRHVCPTTEILEAKFAEAADHLQEQVDRLMSMTCESKRSEVREQIYTLRVARTEMCEALNSALGALKSNGRTHDCDMLAKVGSDHERAYEIAKKYVCEWFSVAGSATGWSSSARSSVSMNSAKQSVAETERSTNTRSKTALTANHSETADKEPEPVDREIDKVAAKNIASDETISEPEKSEPPDNSKWSASKLGISKSLDKLHAIESQIIRRSASHNNILLDGVDCTLSSGCGDRQDGSVSGLRSASASAAHAQRSKGNDIGPSRRSTIQNWQSANHRTISDIQADANNALKRNIPLIIVDRAIADRRMTHPCEANIRETTYHGDWSNKAYVTGRQESVQCMLNPEAATRGRSGCQGDARTAAQPVQMCPNGRCHAAVTPHFAAGNSATYQVNDYNELAYAHRHTTAIEFPPENRVENVQLMYPYNGNQHAFNTSESTLVQMQLDEKKRTQSAPRDARARQCDIHRTPNETYDVTNSKHDECIPRSTHKTMHIPCEYSRYQASPEAQFPTKNLRARSAPQSNRATGTSQPIMPAVLRNNVPTPSAPSGRGRYHAAHPVSGTGADQWADAHQQTPSSTDGNCKMCQENPDENALKNQPDAVTSTIQHHHWPNYSQPAAEFHTSCQYLPIASDEAAASSLNRAAKKELLESAGRNPFDGAAYKFATWRRLLLHKTRGVELSADDWLMILESNTTGAPRQLVREFATCSAQADVAVQSIWKRLETRFGASSLVATSIRNRLESFDVIRPNQTVKLREFSDLLHVALANIQANPDLFSLNTSSGLDPIRMKLPESLRDRWRQHGNVIVKRTGQFPSFEQFVNFVEDVADELNSPLFNTQPKQDTSQQKHDSNRPLNQAFRSQPLPSHRVYLTHSATDGAASDVSDDEPHCVSHPNAKHHTADCKDFKALPPFERKRLVTEQSRCFMCFGRHRRSECNKAHGLKCEKCGSGTHNTLIHLRDINHRHRRGRRNSLARTVNKKDNAKSETVRATVAEAVSASEGDTTVQASESTATVRATNVAQKSVGMEHDHPEDSKTRTCGKCVLVDVHDVNTGRTARTYAVIDDCSTASFVDVALISQLKSLTVPTKYVITTLDRIRAVKWGSVCSGLSIQGVNQPSSFALPRLLSCENMPDTTEEVARPSDVQQVPHLSHLADRFCDFDTSAHVGLLIGRDASQLMKWTYHGDEPPFAVQSKLGWALVGPVETGLNSLQSVTHETVRVCATSPGAYSADVFHRRWDDDEPGQSAEDDYFLEILSQNVRVNSEGHLELPLPFRDIRPRFPPNRAAILRRQTATLNQLKRHPERLADACKSMEKSLQSGQIEKTVSPSDSEECNYISIFQVHNKRKGKYRLVFDSSAACSGVSLNGQLIQGPDSNNRITSVLLRFREHPFAIVADVEGMYNNFFVPPHQRTYQRLFWWSNNDPEKPVAEFRAATHVFGHKSSPAVAIFALRHAAKHGSNHDPVVTTFVNRSFYVDDALHSTETTYEAIDTMTRTRDALQKYGIRLHKLVANSSEILAAFPESDCAATAVDLDMSDEVLEQRTLGITWSLASDSFKVSAGETERPFTKRGILSVINSIYDPFNFTSPVVLRGRLFLREVLSNCSALGWDDKLPTKYAEPWEEWLRLLPLLTKVKVPRPMTRPGFSATHRLLIGFGDASAVAIGFVLYLRSSNAFGEVDIGFICAASKVAPKAATTIPRLELCSSLELARTTAKVRHEMTLPIDDTILFTDSTSVLGFISNYERRYTVYVANRVSAIRNVVDPSVWRFVRSEDNPADLASRPSPPSALDSFWFGGPAFIREREIPTFTFSAKPPDELPELVLADALVVRKTVTDSAEKSSLETIYRNSNDWPTIVATAQRLFNMAAKWLYRARCRLKRPSTCTWYDYQKTVIVLVRAAQSEAGMNENSGSLAPLAPFADQHGALRVGGRLQRSSLPYDARHPLLLPDPNDHPIATCVVRHFHEQSAHQGRIISTGAVRNAGFFIVHAAKAVRRVINDCITCRSLRGKPTVQLMAELPEDRMERTAPFMSSAMDVFGPYYVKTGPRTRRSPGSTKTWVVLFTCMFSRAVHCETLLAMDTATFLLAFRRFVATRGECKRLRCDNGTNFRGADTDLLSLDRDVLKREGTTRNVEFVFSPPKASHANGVVERKVGSVRAVLDSSLAILGHHVLTLDELSTFIAEAASIVNHTPLEADSSDGEAPICPANLLTLRDTPTPPPVGSFDESSLSAYGRRRWERVQYLAEIFWQRWKTGYLMAQQQRVKWATPNRSLAQGDVVLMVEKATKRNSWCKAKVIDATPSSDGLVRKVTVRAFVSGQPKDYQRSVHDLVLLVAAQ